MGGENVPYGSLSKLDMEFEHIGLMGMFHFLCKYWFLIFSVCGSLHFWLIKRFFFPNFLKKMLERQRITIFCLQDLGAVQAWIRDNLAWFKKNIYIYIYFFSLFSFWAKYFQGSFVLINKKFTLVMQNN